MEWTAVLDTQQDDPEWYVVGAEEEVVALGLTEDAARLIAAAPDLLAACKAIFDHYDAKEVMSGDLERISAAIAKAEGRAGQ